MTGAILAASMVDVDAGGPDVPASFTVTATPTEISATRYTLSNYTMGVVTAVKGAGGTGGFSKYWVLYSGPGITTPNQYAQYSCAFTARPEAEGTFTDVWRLRVTDNGTGEIVYSNTVTCTITIDL